MKNIRSSFRKAEKLTVFSFFALALAFIILRHITGNYEFACLIGYFIGMISVLLFAESFFFIESKPKIYYVFFLIFMNFKLVILASLIYLLYRVGLSVVHLILGAMGCQTLAMFALLIMLRIENNKTKAAVSDDKI